MRIGILGSGDVAKALAAGFLKRGDDVMLGTRDPEKLAAWKAAAGDRAAVGSSERTAEFGEILVLATHGMATLEVIESLPKERSPERSSSTPPTRFATTWKARGWQSASMIRWASAFSAPCGGRAS